MRLKLSSHPLLACAVAGAMAMTTTTFALAQEQEQQKSRQRDRQEPEERARAEDRAARAEERAARRAAREAAAAQDAERAVRARAEERARLVPAQPAEPGVMRLWEQEGDGIFRIRPAEVEMKPQTYLGVSTHQASPQTLGEDADIPAGVGLIVSFVDEEGPAGEAGFEQNDVLIKMEDQWLINPAQLTVLIRMRKKGDEVNFTVLRDGEEEEIEVALGEKELPVMQQHGLFNVAPMVVPPVPAVPEIRGLPPGQGPWMHGMQGLHPIPPERMQEIEEHIQKAMAELEKQMQGQDLGDLELRMQELREQLQQRQLELERLPQDVNRRLQRGLMSGGRLLMNNEDVTLRMVNEDGEVTIVVSDADGETLYEGPYPDDEELEELPEEAQEIIRQAGKYLPRGEREQQAPSRPRRADDEDEENAPSPPARRRESIPV